MKQKAKKLLKHPLVTGSIIVVAGNLVANIFNFFFSLLMVRLLSPVDFGTLQSINAIITYPALVATSITPLIVIFAATYFAEKKLDLVKSLYINFNKIFFLIALVLSLIFFVFMPQINSFFHINNNLLMILTDLIIFFSIMSVVNSSFLQANLSFKFYIFLVISIALLKLIFGYIFVSMGYKVEGAIAGTLIGFVVPFLISFLPLRFLFNQQTNNKPVINTKLFITYGIPSILISIGLSGFITNDLLLVKHYFEGEAAGLYAGLSIMGRIIFFISSPILSVMFPLIVQQHTKKVNYLSTFFMSFIFILLPSVSITLFYTIFPVFSTLFILHKDKYLAIIPYLTIFSVFISIYSLNSILANFYLSIKKTKFAYSILLFAILHVLFIINFHQNFQQIIYISLSLNIILFVYLLIYFPFALKKPKSTQIIALTPKT